MEPKEDISLPVFASLSRLVLKILERNHAWYKKIYYWSAMNLGQKESSSNIKNGPTNAIDGGPESSTEKTQTEQTRQNTFY